MQCLVNNSTKMLTYSAIEIHAQSFNDFIIFICRSERGIWSDIFFLAEKPDVAFSLCKDWLENEEKMPSLPFDDVQPCPCTVDQALLDVVRFQPDPDCNMFNNKNSSCFYRRNATHCIRLSKAGWDVFALKR